MSASTYTVLIPTWKRPHKIKICLEHLENQIEKPDQIIVIARNEDKDGIDVINSFKDRLSNLELLIADKPGVVYAENVGLSYIKNDYICFIDDDGYAPKDWLFKIKKFFNENPSAKALGGSDIIKTEPWTYYDYEIHEVGKVTFYGKVIGNHHRKALGAIRNVDVLKGVNMVFKNKDLPLLDMKLAGIDGNHGNGSQWELDLCLSVNKSGKSIYFDPSLVVVHDSDHSTHIKDVVAFNNTHNMSYVMLKHLSFFRKICFVFYALVIGNEQLPGLLKLIFQFIKVRDRKVFSIFKNKFFGFIAGFRTYLRN
jgi:glycosyltransferase involved in cell wall biosynthesis